MFLFYNLKIVFEIRANKWAEEFIEIADSVEVMEDSAMSRVLIEVAKLRLEARKWIVSRILPKTYGEKTTIAGDTDNPLELVIRRIG